MGLFLLSKTIVNSWQNKTWITRLLLFGYAEQLNMTNTIKFQYHAEFWEQHDTTNCVKDSRHENNILYLYCVFSKIVTLSHLKENIPSPKLKSMHYKLRQVKLKDFCPHLPSKWYNWRPIYIIRERTITSPN